MLLVAVAACGDQATAPDAMADLTPQMSLESNGFPSGGHDYLLNIIGVPQDKTADMDGNHGRRIFVQLNGGETVTNPGGKWKPGKSWADLDKINKILLMPGDFWVADANATDNDGALFYLPDPCADADPTTACDPSYDVYARALGTPNGKATITTCADEEGAGFDGSDDVWCGMNGITMERKGGKPKAQNVTENLLKMVISVDPGTDPGLAACLGVTNTDPIDVWLFDDCMENYFWNNDNKGLKLLQLRFYSNGS
jgi:hypothetical protein